MKVKKICTAVGIIFAVFVYGTTALGLTQVETDKIKHQIIIDSVKKYKGNCPCPYSKMKDGKICGKFSAYSKKGAKKPVCYASDVTSKMVESFKK